MGIRCKMHGSGGTCSGLGPLCSYKEAQGACSNDHVAQPVLYDSLWMSQALLRGRSVSSLPGALPHVQQPWPR